MSRAHLSPFEVGQVKAHMEHGLGCVEIAKRIYRSDGKTKFGETAIVNCMNKLRKNKNWRGGREEGSGALRKTTPKQDREIVRWVLKNRGKVKISVSRLRKQFIYLRNLSDTLVEERLQEADLQYLRRRNKPIVTKEYLEARIEYCNSVKRKHDSTLLKWAYTDGTVYYLDRNDSEHENSKRRCLGTHVWRRSDNREALEQDCIGPSNYSKGQGFPFRVWGVLACGVLHVHILDEGDVLDSTLYAELIEDKFEEWCGPCDYLVCDFEKSLRSEAALLALDKINLKLVDNYPKCSQDFNAIENAWAILKERLDQTMPQNLEGREEFIVRLKAAVRWANTNRADQLWFLCNNQKERARECLAQKPPGGRTRW
jgi:hypothetical protein